MRIMTSREGRPRAAAGVILRRAGSLRTVYLVERRAELAFFGGYWAFPGGVCDAADADVPIARGERDAAEDHVPIEGGEGGGGIAAEDARFLAAAARELFEETGVLCVRPAMHADSDAIARLRAALQQGETTFGAALAQRGLAVDGARFAPVCRMITPPFSPIRYETLFFLVDAAPGDAPTVQASELAAGEFVDAAAALARWRAGEMLIVPPAILLMRMLAEAAGPDPRAEFLRAAHALTAQYARGKIHEVLFTPGVRKISLLTETRPPADHTNAYLVGERELYLVDPGAARAEEQARMFEAIDDVLASGSALRAIVLTHHHPDHVAAAPAAAARYRVPIWAHAETGRALAGRIAVARALEDGERIALGSAPDGAPGWTLEVLHTPGHAPGHVALRESRYGAILAGDMVSTASTIVIDPHDGHLATYLRSLRRLRALPRGTIYPAHGPAKRDSHAVIDAYLEHRARRERKVIAALTPEFESADAILARAYDDVPEPALPLARLSLAAGLVKLCEEGLAEERAGSYRARAAAGSDRRTGSV
jgi:glyoxylase-like metal-dependent hydrolase (beta-lactamase superfamily II)/8-oxo-dGTP pyrophosphatase MutT (NUDIX family)